MVGSIQPMKSPNTILIVDDERYTLEFLAYNLERNGFRVYTSTSGREALELAGDVIPQMILLDIMMPGMDGVETCMNLRKNSKLNKTVIAFLTARSEDYSQIAGFEAGADDYIAKPVRISVLIPRIKSHFRRLNKAQEPRVVTIGDIVIDPERHEVTKGDVPLHLNRKEFQILSLLAGDPGRVFATHEIFTSVWGRGQSIHERTVNVHISRLRKKLGPDVIMTRGKEGYSLK